MYRHHPRPPVQLSRYSSAPAASFLAALADSDLACAPPYPACLLAAGDSSAESSCQASAGYDASAYPLDGGVGSTSPAPPPPTSLVRHRSSPADLLVQHVIVDTGSGIGYVPHFPNMGRTKPQYVSSRQDSLTSISEMSSTGDMDEHAISGNVYETRTDLHTGSWDNPHSFGFGTPTSKCNTIDDRDVMAAMDDINSQYNLTEAQIDMSAVEKLIQIQQDAVPCKIRAKRGCATHPRSIAERVRRTKISEKLKRLQEIVPNMDKQTNTADMLELAVQHIRILQDQIETLKQECESCTCTSIHDIIDVP